MKVSLNEIETLARRAAHGAGYSWGHAEEAGKTARWLMTHGFPGVDIVLDVLRSSQSQPGPQTMPVFAEGVWQSPSGDLCPLIAGAILGDHAGKITADTGITFSSVRQPLALAPYAAAAAGMSGTMFELSWHDAKMTCNAHGCALITTTPVRQLCATAGVACRPVLTPVSPPRGQVANCSVDADAWHGLNRFARRMYAPASEASRLAGAGAGTTDND